MNSIKNNLKFLALAIALPMMLASTTHAMEAEILQPAEEVDQNIGGIHFTRQNIRQFMRALDEELKSEEGRVIKQEFDRCVSSLFQDIVHHLATITRNEITCQKSTDMVNDLVHNLAATLRREITAHESSDMLNEMLSMLERRLELITKSPNF